MEIPLISGKALVNLATDQAVLLFEDSNGGRHYSTSYTINKLFCLEELSDNSNKFVYLDCDC